MKVVELKLKDEDDNIEYLRQLMVNSKLSLKGNSSQAKGVSLLSQEIRRLIDEEELEGLCLLRFYENITIEDLDAKEVSIGERLQIGDTVQEVISIGGRCFKKCKRIQSGEKCDLFMNVIFTKIIKGGFVRIDDEVKLLGK